MVLCARGAYAGYCTRESTPPNHKGQQPSEPPHRPLCSDLPGTHAERGPRPLVLSPFGFCGSRRQWVVNPRTRVSGARAIKDNRPPRLQKLLEPEPSRTTGPRVDWRSWSPRPQKGKQAPVFTKAPGTRDHKKGNRPSCLQKFLDLDPSRATGPRDYRRSFLPENVAGQPALVSTKAVAKLDHQGTTSPTGIQISPFRLRKMNYPSRHALRNVRLKSTESETSRTTSPRVCESPMTWTQEGSRPTCPHGSSSSAGG